MSSCSSEYEQRLKISATTWIGYTPLFYAKEKGWLQPLNIKLLNITSLAENMYIYQAGNSDAYTGTQYEYNIMKNQHNSLTPIMMFDKSNGGDVVMSNFSVKELLATVDEIDVYLELDSINSIILQDFLKNTQLEEKKINYINKDQIQIKQLKMNMKPTLIVTYAPYNIELEKEGFRELSSTKNNAGLLVVDAMFTTVEVFKEHEKQFRELKKLVDKSIDILDKNPKEFYETVKPYLLEINYKDFQAALNDIVWINKSFSKELEGRLKKRAFPTRDLIQ